MNLHDIRNRLDTAREILSRGTPGKHHPLLTKVLADHEYLLSQRALTPFPRTYSPPITYHDLFKYEVFGSAEWVPSWFIRWRTRRKHSRYLRRVTAAAVISPPPSRLTLH